MSTKRILTGDRPTGCLHLGHYLGSLQTRVKLQAIHEQYVMIADVQALTDNFENPSKIQHNVVEIVKDYISVGIDPNKTIIFIQSQIPEITELTIYFLNLVTLGRLQRNPTVKSEMLQKGYAKSIPAGFLCYPVNQAADITIFQAELVPVGHDQIPMIEQTNEIVRKFNRTYNTNYLKECEYILGTVPRLMGIDGKAKASKSLNNAIFISDSQQEIKNKVFQMYTDPLHIKATDPGSVKNNVVFQYLDAFHPDKEEVQALKKQYKKGGLGDVVIKNILNTTLQNLLQPMREKRSTITQKDAIEILSESTAKAKHTAKQNIGKIREILGIKYSQFIHI